MHQCDERALLQQENDATDDNMKLKDEKDEEEQDHPDFIKHSSESDSPLSPEFSPMDLLEAKCILASRAPVAQLVPDTGSTPYYCMAQADSWKAASAKLSALLPSVHCQASRVKHSKRVLQGVA